MKFNKIIVSLFFVTQLMIAHDQQKSVEIVEPVVVQKCSCTPVEHVFYKLCVQNYNKIFVNTGLIENYDIEGLSANIVEAVALLAQTIKFVDLDGQPIVPTLNAKGNLILSMSNNSDYLLCKEILHDVDATTNLSAQELLQAWLQQLQLIKSK